MSWVAEQKAITQKKASVAWKKKSPGKTNAIPAIPPPISICMIQIHQRFVLIRSTNGLQRGLITQGKYNQLV